MENNKNKEVEENNKEEEKRTNKKALGILGLGSALAVLGGGTYLAHNLINSGIPEIDGYILLDGLEDDQAEVIRDRNGTSNIKSNSLKDLFFTQGFVHAQDRLFQMDISRRLASGELSEVFGKDTLESDKYYLTIGLKRGAENSYREYRQDELVYLNEYVRGINTYIERAIEDNNLPTEFRILNYKPSLWTVMDTLLIFKLISHELDSNYKNQIFRQYIVEHYSVDEGVELFPKDLYPSKVSIGDDESLLNLMYKLDGNQDINGSNAWVISGEKTESGYPIIAGDPHLKLKTPSIWYINTLECDEFKLNGSTIPGIPGIIYGSNSHISWVGANLMADNQDVVIEALNEKNKDEYLYNEKWEKIRKYHYRIKIKRGMTVKHLVRETHNGPIISDYERLEEFPLENKKALSLKWTALEGGKEFKALLNIWRSKNWDDFNKALDDHVSPCINFIYADKDKNIGFRSSGRIPIRKEEHGLLPVIGWDGDSSWDYIPYNHLPKGINPESGYFIAANNMVISEKYPYHLTDDWAEDYRYRRIEELILENKDFNIVKVNKIQNDIKNLKAVRIIPILDKIINKGEYNLVDEVFVELNHWYEKGCYDELDSSGSLIFNNWMNEIVESVLGHRVPESLYRNINNKEKLIIDLIEMESDGVKSVWLSKLGGIEKVLLESLSKTMNKLSKDNKNTMKRWRYENKHILEFNHILSDNKFYKKIFNRNEKIGIEGSGNTIKTYSVDMDGSSNHGGSWKFIMDLEDMNKSRQIVAPGNSGHPKSIYYQNNIEKLVRGNLYEVSLDEKDGDILLLIQNRYTGVFK